MNESIESLSSINGAFGQQVGSIGQDLNKIKEEDFFKLLTVELSTQDPLEPKKDSEFLSQVMQISSLEQARAMQADMAAMRMEQQIIQANAMLGRDVDFGGTVKGTVTSIKMEQGRPMIEVEGELYDLQKLMSLLCRKTKTNPWKDTSE